MVSCGLELSGISLSVLGWVLSVISCALPMWIVFRHSYDYYGHRNPRIEWWGLWMSCESQSTGQMQCRSRHFIDPVLQTFRALSVLAIILGVVGVFINIVRAKCTNFIHNERVKARLMVSSGGMLITAALLQLAPVVWIVSILIWYSYADTRHNAGVALHLGWFSSVLMLIGGSILCCFFCKQENQLRKSNIHGQSHVQHSVAPKSTTQSSNIRIDVV